MNMTPQEFVSFAQLELGQLTGGHAKAVAGKHLTVFVHGWDRWANGGHGGRRVTLRVEGQYLDRGEVYLAKSTQEAEEFATKVREILSLQN